MIYDEPNHGIPIVEALREDFIVLRAKMTTGLQAELKALGVPKPTRRLVADFMRVAARYSAVMEGGIVNYIDAPGPPLPEPTLPDFEPEKGCPC